MESLPLPLTVACEVWGDEGWVVRESEEMGGQKGLQGEDRAGREEW